MAHHKPLANYTQGENKMGGGLAGKSFWQHHSFVVYREFSFSSENNKSPT